MFFFFFGRKKLALKTKERKYKEEQNDYKTPKQSLN